MVIELPSDSVSTESVSTCKNLDLNLNRLSGSKIRKIYPLKKQYSKFPYDKVSHTIGPKSLH